MEKLVRVKSQGALVQRNWQNPKGETVVISSVELVLTDGIDTFAAEASDQLALTINQKPLSQDAIYGVQCRMTVRESTNKQTGEARQFTGIRILNIQAV